MNLSIENVSIVVENKFLTELHFKLPYLPKRKLPLIICTKHKISLMKFCNKSKGKKSTIRTFDSGPEASPNQVNGHVSEESEIKIKITTRTNLT